MDNVADRVVYEIKQVKPRVVTRVRECVNVKRLKS